MTRKTQSMQRRKLFTEEEQRQDGVAVAGTSGQVGMPAAGVSRQDDMSIASPNIDFAHIGITDDRMFGTVFQNEEECRELLQRILGIHIREIHVIAQMPIEGSFLGKGSRLDIYAKDEDGNVYDIEMQTTMQKILPLRSRYYHSEMDSYQIKKGQPYDKLKKSIVIFICTFDFFGDDRSVYTFENICLENAEIKLKDKCSTIFVNIGGKRDGLSEDLTKLLDYFKTGTPMDAYTQGLQEEVEEARYDDEWRTNYMTFEMMMEEKKQEGRAEGREEGEAIGELKSIIALVIKKMQRGKFLEETAEELEEDVAVIAPIYEAVKEAAPEYDVEEIYRKVRSKEGQMIPKERQL
jgi:predicted transposase/invertase (TIGR01784 family)